MPICILRSAFVDCVARAMCASGLTHIWDEGVDLAEQVCEAMGFDRDPAVEVEVNCRLLWLEFFKRHQRRETPCAGESYANLAREMLRQVVSASVSASEQEGHVSPAAAASDEYVSEILRGIEDEEHEWLELDASRDESVTREPEADDDPG